MGKKISLIYFICTRGFFHMFSGTMAHIAVSLFIDIKIWQTALFIVAPIAILTEFFQHKRKVADSINRFILIREGLVLLSFVVLFVVLYFVRDVFTYHQSLLILAWFSLALSIILSYVEKMKPKGEHWEWKHFVDVFFRILGPVIMYPIIQNLLF